MRWIRWIDTLVAVFVVALVVTARMPVNTWAYGSPVINASAKCGKVGCGAGFNGSYHDFVNGPGASSHGYVLYSNGANITVGQCTLCHTPHSALLTSLLWNHHLSNNTQFTWDISNTMAGTPFATIQNNWNGSTTKCLSCHDGSVSPSTINWFEGTTPVAGTPSCAGTNGTSGPCSRTPDFGLGGAMGTIPPNGANPQTQGATHPVAMPYPCKGVASTYDGVTTGSSIVFKEWVSSPALPIRIYTDIGGTTTGTITRGEPGNCTAGYSGIECSSCHDVHNRENVDIDLLRGYVTGTKATGYICEKCHNK